MEFEAIERFSYDVRISKGGAIEQKKSMKLNYEITLSKQLLSLGFN